MIKRIENKTAEVAIYVNKTGLLVWAFVLLALGMFIGYGVRLYQDMSIINDYIAFDAANPESLAERLEEPIISSVDFDEYDFSGFPTEGDPDAPVVIFEISDLACPYCQQFHDEARQAIIDRYGGQIRWVFIDSPLDRLHPLARGLHEAAYCAGEQNAQFDFINLAFSKAPIESAEDAYRYAEALGLEMDLFESCISAGRYMAQVSAGVGTAREMGFSGTPAIVIAQYDAGMYGENQVVIGAQAPEVFFSVIDQYLGGE